MGNGTCACNVRRSHFHYEWIAESLGCVWRLCHSFSPLLARSRLVSLSISSLVSWSLLLRLFQSCFPPCSLGESCSEIYCSVYDFSSVYCSCCGYSSRNEYDKRCEWAEQCVFAQPNWGRETEKASDRTQMCAHTIFPLIRYLWLTYRGIYVDYELTATAWVRALRKKPRWMEGERWNVCSISSWACFNGTHRTHLAQSARQPWPLTRERRQDAQTV